jgi:ABC-type multidrug transport system fused ATPase/permease subunit
MTKKNLPFVEIISFTRLYKKYVGAKWILFLFSAIIPAFLDGIGISMIIPLLNLVIEPGAKASASDGDFAYKLLNFFNIPVSLGNILLFIIGIYTFKLIANFSNHSFKSYLYVNLVKNMKYNLYNRLMRLDYSAFNQRNTGYYTNLATSQMNQFFNGFIFLTQFYSKVFAATSYLAFSFFIDWRFSFIAGFSGLLIVGSFRGFSKTIKKLSSQTTEQESMLTGFFIQAMQAFKYLAATAGFETFTHKLDNSINKIKNQRLKSEVIINFFESSYETLTVFFICFLIWIQVSVMGKPLVSMLLSVFLFHRAVSNIVITQKDWQYLMNASGGILSIDNEFNNTTVHKEQEGNKELEKLTNGIRFNNVSYAYDDKEVISGVSFFIPAKSTVALVGESGAGKSTIIDLLTLILKPGQGTIELDNISHKELKLQSWRSKIGFVSQDIQLFDDSIANNISLWQVDPESREGRERIEQAARMAHCHEFIIQSEKNYGSMIGDRGLKLSGGQRQRIAIARELFKSPEVLILDEATSALDSESEFYIKKTLDELKGQLTVVMIAHRLSTVKEADFIIVMKDGKIQETGSFNELISRNGYFTEMVEYQKI